MKKLISLVVTAALLSAILGGCSLYKPNIPGTTAAPGVSPQASSQKTSINGFNTDLYTADTVMFKVDGVPVYWPEYLYWLASNISYIYKSVGYYPTDWNATLTEGQTIRDYVLNSANNAIAMYRGVEKKAAELGYKLDDADQAEIENSIQEGVTYFESKEAFLENLKSSYLNEELYRYMMGESILYKKIFTGMYGENAGKFSVTDTMAFANTNGYIKAKHIYMAGSTDADKDNEVKAKMQGILDKLKAAGSGDQLNTLFDQLMKENSQDTGLTQYPDGYVFKDGDMDTEFQNAAEGLSAGGLSDIVKSSYGYHIILRLPLTPEDKVFDASGSDNDDGTGTLRYYAAYDAFRKTVDGWTKSVKIETTDALKNIDMNKLYK